MQQVRFGQAEPVMGKATPSRCSRGKMHEPVNTSVIALQSGLDCRWCMYRPNAEMNVKTPMSAGEDNDKEQIFAQITIF